MTILITVKKNDSLYEAWKTRLQTLIKFLFERFFQLGLQQTCPVIMRSTV